MWSNNLVKSVFLLILALNLQKVLSKHVNFQQFEHRTADDSHHSRSSRSLSSSHGERTYSESELIDQILQQDNEILDEQSELEAGEGLQNEIEMKKKKHRKVSFPVPAYLKLIDDNLQRGTTVFGHGPITRAWLPVEIIRNETSKLSEVRFQQTKNRNSFGDFINVEVILTLKSDAEINDDGGALVQILFNDGTGRGETRTLSKTTLFYTFNATTFLENTLSENLEHPKPIGISFQVLYKNNRTENRLFFDELFDVQVDRPFILFQYKELPGNLVGTKINEKGRRRRSAPDFSKPKLADLSPKPLKPPSSASLKPNSDLKYNETTLAFPGTLISKEVTNSSKAKNSSVSTTVPHNPNCRRVDWSVETNEIEWFNAVQPKELNLGYCSGDCPFPLQNDHYNYTLHSFFVDRYRLLKVFDVPKNLPRSCCVPISYKPVYVITQEEENNVVLAEYHDILVDSCGCR